MSSIGKNIKRLRKEKSISQDKLSKLADISLNTIVKLELDQNPNPSCSSVAGECSTLYSMVMVSV